MPAPAPGRARSWVCLGASAAAAKQRICAPVTIPRCAYCEEVPIPGERHDDNRTRARRRHRRPGGGESAGQGGEKQKPGARDQDDRPFADAYLPAGHALSAVPEVRLPHPRRHPARNGAVRRPRRAIPGRAHHRHRRARARGHHRAGPSLVRLARAGARLPHGARCRRRSGRTLGQPGARLLHAGQRAAAGCGPAGVQGRRFRDRCRRDADQVPGGADRICLPGGRVPDRTRPARSPSRSATRC
jgi:hypothetical protein